MLTHVHPSRLRFTCRARPTTSGFLPSLVDPPKARQVPRAPLPATGVTSYGVTSRITSEGIAPPSSLIRAHAPDHNPPFNFAFGYFERSLQVAVSPCWKMALPGVISAILVWVLGPLPRGAPSVHLPVSSRTASASPHRAQVRRARHPSQCNFNDAKTFEAAVIP